MIGFIVKEVVLTLAIGIAGLFNVLMFSIVLEADNANK